MQKGSSNLASPKEQALDTSRILFKEAALVPLESHSKRVVLLGSLPN